MRKKYRPYKEKYDLSQELLKELVSYNPDDGVLTWLCPRYNKKGHEAGSKNGNGYKQTTLFGWIYPNHILAWLYMTGEFPPKDRQIDHINRIKDDNRWENLRLSDYKTNAYNAGKVSTMGDKALSSKYKGVHFHKRSQRWIAKIKLNGKTIQIGQFKDEKQAALAWNKKAKELHGEFAYQNEVD